MRPYYNIIDIIPREIQLKRHIFYHDYIKGARLLSMFMLYYSSFIYTIKNQGKTSKKLSLSTH